MMVRKYWNGVVLQIIVRNIEAYVQDIKDSSDLILVCFCDLLEALTGWQIEVHIEPENLRNEGTSHDVFCLQ